MCSSKTLTFLLMTLIRSWLVESWREDLTNLLKTVGKCEYLIQYWIVVVALWSHSWPIANICQVYDHLQIIITNTISWSHVVMLSYDKVRLKIIALVIVFQDMVDLNNLLVHSWFKNVMLFRKPIIGDLQLSVPVNDENNLKGG